MRAQQPENSLLDNPCNQLKEDVSVGSLILARDGSYASVDVPLEDREEQEQSMGKIGEEHRKVASDLFFPR